MELAPKICYTAAGVLIHNNKILLVKHKKLNIWLNPGGHLEPDELPHQAAEREFFEETGVAVRAKQHGHFYDAPEITPLPLPFSSNLHWVCEENFKTRQKDPDSFTPVAPWTKGCERHLGWLYFVEPVEAADPEQSVSPDTWPESQFDPKEILDLAWFTQEQVARLSPSETKADIKEEVAYAFSLQ